MTERPHILVVDDDREIQTLLRDYLETKGFRATAVGNTAQARRALDRDRADLIVLDLMLPNESGLDFCRTLRRESTTPVIMLTALGETVDRIVGLETGADDYLPKPFDPQELVSRIRAVLRRGASAAPDDRPSAGAYRFGGWRLDVIARTLTDASGTRVDLGGAEFRLLELLLSHAGRVLTRNELSEQLRGRDYDPFDRSIDVRISRLRQALRDDAKTPDIIKTVYGEGYTIGVRVEAE
jgi:two-component system, OmpR family, response regulator